MEKDFKKYNEIAEILKVIAHPVRLCILQGLLQKGECNVSHMQSCLDIPQSTVSQHLQKLRVAGLIRGDRSGLEITYKVCDDKIRIIMDAIFSQQE